MTSDKKISSTLASRVEAEVDDVHRLRRKRPILFVVLLLGITAFAAGWLYDHFYGIPELKKKLETRQNELNEKRNEVILLETKLAPFKTVALERYGGDNSQALAQLAQDVSKFENELRAVESKVRNLSLALEVEFRTKWKGGKPPDPSKWFWLGGGTKAMTGTFILENNRDSETEFHHVENMRLIAIDDGWARLSYRAAAAPGSTIFGELPRRIQSIRDFSFVAFGLKKEFSEDGIGEIRQIKLQFFVNGVPLLFGENVSSGSISLHDIDSSTFVTVHGEIPLNQTALMQPAVKIRASDQK